MHASERREERVDYQSLFDQYIEGDERGVVLIGSGRRVLQLNSKARTMLGYTGDLPQSIGAIAHDMNVEFAAGDALHDRRAGVYESYAPAPDRLLRFQFLPILVPTGEPILVVATIEDITLHRHLETVRRDFVANVSHELRTPLASIRLLVETLQGGATADPEAAQHFLHRIDIEVEAMAGLVEELLELSRLESGVLALDLESVEVGEMLEGVVSRLAPMAGEKGVVLRFDFQEELPPVVADHRRLQQVLMNLVHNAIKFTPAGGEVVLRARRQGRGVQIEVIDTGVGMTPDEAGRVFERFYKIDPGRKREEGAGLGLAIARHLVESHGSRLQAISEPNRGSRFTFTLPMA